MARAPGCLNELAWFIERLVDRALAPAPFVDDGRRLLAHYRKNPRPPRTRGYAPRLDAIFMEPEFEELVVSDETILLGALGLSRRPKEWPAFKDRAPKAIFTEAVACAAKDVRGRVRGDTKSNRHGWALEVIRHAGSGSSLAQHTIVRRLGTLVAS